MWCQHCQQDVPAVSTAAGKPLECARCQKAINRGADCDAIDGTDLATPQLSWQAEQRMRQIGRSLRSPVTPVVVDAYSADADLGFDQSHAAPARQAEPSTPERPQTAARHQTGSERQMQAIAWLATVFGLGLAAGGVVLLGMGLFGQHPEFWKWGVGVTLAGQAILIAGLIRVLASLWSNSRLASHRLADLQKELAQVQRSAETIVAQRPGGASGFYGELARGTSPTILLANLKGQIDHLAMRM